MRRPGYAAQIEEMDAEVREEGERLRYLQAADLADRASAADDRQRTLVEVAKRGLGAGRARERSPLATCRACWIATVARPGRKGSNQ